MPLCGRATSSDIKSQLGLARHAFPTRRTIREMGRCSHTSAADMETQLCIFAVAPNQAYKTTASTLPCAVQPGPRGHLRPRANPTESFQVVPCRSLSRYPWLFWPIMVSLMGFHSFIGRYLKSWIQHQIKCRLQKLRSTSPFSQCWLCHYRWGLAIGVLRPRRCICIATEIHLSLCSQPRFSCSFLLANETILNKVNFCLGRPSTFNGCGHLTPERQHLCL